MSAQCTGGAPTLCIWCLIPILIDYLSFSTPLHLYLFLLFMVGVVLSSPPPQSPPHQRGRARTPGREWSAVRSGPAPPPGCAIEVALQILSVADGRIDAGDERRFYAPVPSEHWNQATPYWLTDEDRPGQRFEHWDRAPGTAPPRTTEQEAER